MWVMRPVDDLDRPAVESALVELEDRLTPGNRDNRIAMLARLVVHYPNVSKDEGSLAVILADMADDLADFSDLHVAWACAEWRQTESWWPKPAELREKALTLDCFARVYRRRARVLLGQAEPCAFELPKPPQGDPEPMSEERKREIASHIKPGPMAAPLRAMLENG